MNALRARLDCDSIPEPNSGCRLWTAGLTKQGYARICWDGRPQLAHRLAWREANGPIPPGICICHKCDVRSCIEEAHLFPGTRADNMADMYAKGRSSAGRPRPKVWGERNGHAKHSEETMRKVIAASGTYLEIARRFGVSKTAVGYAKRGIQWAHLTAPELKGGAP